MGAQLAAPVAALHAAAFGLGYVLCKMLGFDEKTARTVSIETGARCWLPVSTLTLSKTLTTFVTKKGRCPVCAVTRQPSGPSAQR